MRHFIALCAICAWCTAFPIPLKVAVIKDYESAFDAFALMVFNPLTTGQFPVLPVTARKKALGDNSLSYPPSRLFGSLIVLSFLRTNKPIRSDLLSIFLEDFRGPRKMVFLLKIVHS